MKRLSRVLLFTVVVAWAGVANSMPVVVGYDFASTGGQNFESITLPSFASVAQSSPYQLQLLDNVLMDFVLQSLLNPGEMFNFGPLGVDRFRIVGIDEELMLAPDNALAFPLAASFTASSSAPSITIAPLLADMGTVPTPATLALLGVGCAGLGWPRRKKS